MLNRLRVVVAVSGATNPIPGQSSPSLAVSHILAVMHKGL